MCWTRRQRITNFAVQSAWLLCFQPGLPVLCADSSLNRNIVDLDMLLKPYRLQKPDGTVVDTLYRQYYIKDVFDCDDYDPLTLEENNAMPYDTVRTDGIDILYGKNGRSIRPGVLRKSNYIMPGRLYNERTVEQTYSSFATLRALRKVNIRFSRSKRTTR